MRGVRTGLGLLMVGLLLAVIVRNREAIGQSLSLLSWPSVVGAFVAVVLSLAAAYLSWRAVMQGLGASLPIVAGSRVFFVAQLGKYMPGSVWPLLAQMELGKDLGVARSRSGVGGLVALMIGLISGSVVGVGLLLVTSSSLLTQYRWLVLVPVVGLLALVPPVLQRVIDLGLRLARRDGDPHDLPPRALLAAIGWALLMWLLLGVQCYLLARDLATTTDQLLLVSAGAFAASWVVGFLVVFAPAGAGAREAALVLALSPVMSRADALSLALVSRVLMSLGDLAAAGTVSLPALRSRRSAARRAAVHGDLDAPSGG